MDFKDHLEKSWKTFTGFLPALLINTLALAGMSIVTLGIMAPVCTAGYFQSLLLAIRDNRKPEVSDLFSHMRLFLPLLAFTIVAGIVLIIGFSLLVLPGIIVGVALSFFCLYMLPLMTDQEMGLIDAVKESSRMAMQDPVADHVVVVVLYVAITTLGNSTGIGALFTQPFATLFIMSAFEERKEQELPVPEKSEKPNKSKPETPEAIEPNETGESEEMKE